MIYDISVPIHNGMHVWPSDPAVAIDARVITSGDDSHEIRVTSIHCGSHTGTHLDAPSHMLTDGGSLNDLSLDALIGPVRVVHLPGLRSIDRETLAEIEWNGVARVLFRTDNSAHWRDQGFFEDFVYLEPDGARFLTELGIRLVGIDYLSIDAFHSDDHASHMILLGESVVILEGLDLSDITADDYQLCALPMKLDHGDGAPVRAVLMK